MMKLSLSLMFVCALLLSACSGPGLPRFSDPALPGAQPIYKANRAAKTRWASFENPRAAKGQGGRENAGAKGHAYDSIKAGETKTLLDVPGCGTVTRIWMTFEPRDPQMLRAMRVDMYWDGCDKPAVSAPMGDFFGALLGRMVPSESELFADPEGRSFNCYIPMPFRKGARITLTNESGRDMGHLFYDVSVVLQDRPHDRDTLYFHAAWRREPLTRLGRDFEILPLVQGRGRFLGAHIGYMVDSRYTGWWGEGEVKMYLDGDGQFPTLVGTGTEDYPGSGWGLEVFKQRYQGTLVADGQRGQYGFYRYHIPDPVYFQRDIRVTLAQIGGYGQPDVLKMLKQGLPMKPVSVDSGGKFTRLLEQGPGFDLEKATTAGDWINYYRQDDVSAVALFYLDSPRNALPPLAPLKERVAGILAENPDQK